MCRKSFYFTYIIQFGGKNQGYDNVFAVKLFFQFRSNARAFCYIYKVTLLNNTNFEQTYGNVNKNKEADLYVALMNE